MTVNLFDFKTNSFLLIFKLAVLRDFFEGESDISLFISSNYIIFESTIQPLVVLEQMPQYPIRNRHIRF